MVGKGKKGEEREKRKGNGGKWERRERKGKGWTTLPSYVEPATGK